MHHDEVVSKLRQIYVMATALKEEVRGHPALEGDIDRIAAISWEKLLLMDPESIFADEGRPLA